jgi:hyaluronate lyase
MFNLSSVLAPITKATGYLTSVSEGQSGFTNQAYLVSNSSWTESGITWNNAPPLSGTLVGSWTVPAVHTQIFFDVTSQAIAAQSSGNLLSIGITSPSNIGSNGWVEYGSKENGTASSRPVIVVTTTQ